MSKPAPHLACPDLEFGFLVLGAGQLGGQGAQKSHQIAVGQEDQTGPIFGQTQAAGVKDQVP